MRRTTRKALVNLVLFLGALSFILYLNRPPPSTRSNHYAWSRIQYKTSSEVLPGPHGICPGLADTWKPALVVARVESDGDPKWLEDLAKLYHLCIYTADAPNTTSNDLQVPENRGHEAMAYLTFIIDNYNEIPMDGAVFVHGSRWAWHNDAPDYDNAALLGALNMTAALETWGYHNLRCDWSLSTCYPSAKPQGSLDTSVQAVLAPWDSRAVSDAALPGALATLFGDDLKLDRTHSVRSQCCAQFAVARDRIWQHSRDEYFALRQWLLDPDTAPSDDKIAGRILSYVWHILFIRQDEYNPLELLPDGVNLDRLNHQACPRAQDCYCRLYGRCDLEGCNEPGSCYGQYVLPPKLKVKIPPAS